MIPKHSTSPWISITTLTIILAFALILILSDHADQGTGLTMATLLLVNLPSALSAIFSERASRDIRNGTVIEKARQGAVEALADTEMVKETHPVVQEIRKDNG